MLWRASPRTSTEADAGVEQGERKTHLHEAGLDTCHRRRLPSSVAVEVSQRPCLCLNKKPSQGTISQTGCWFSHHVFNKGSKSAFTHTLTNNKCHFSMLKRVLYLTPNQTKQLSRRLTRKHNKQTNRTRQNKTQKSEEKNPTSKPIGQLT